MTSDVNVLYDFAVSFGANALLIAILLWIICKSETNKVEPDSCATGTGTGNNSRHSELEDNKVLRLKGKNVIRHLLTCNVKDPYSVLGLNHSASNDDIKRCYRKLALLVHPDKNNEPDAAKAFQILGQVNDMIGQPDKREQFDRDHKPKARQETETVDVENMMYCGKCNKIHKRIPTDRNRHYARYCLTCNKYHFAYEGDVWTELNMELINYYACMAGKIYNITEWFTCQLQKGDNDFGYITVGAHPVFYHIWHNDRNRQQEDSGAQSWRRNKKRSCRRRKRNSWR